MTGQLDMQPVTGCKALIHYSFLAHDVRSVYVDGSI